MRWGWYSRHFGAAQLLGSQPPWVIPEVVMLAMPEGDRKLYRGHAYYPAWDLAVADLRRALVHIWAVTRTE